MRLNLLKAMLRLPVTRLLVYRSGQTARTCEPAAAAAQTRWRGFYAHVLVEIRRARTAVASEGLRLSKYSVGTGDRFAHQAKAQLQACVQALEHGMEVVPVWNKSNREHTIIGSDPAVTRAAAD